MRRAGGGSFLRRRGRCRRAMHRPRVPARAGTGAGRTRSAFPAARTGAAARSDQVLVTVLRIPFVFHAGALPDRGELSEGVRRDVRREHLVEDAGEEVHVAFTGEAGFVELEPRGNPADGGAAIEP